MVGPDEARKSALNRVRYEAAQTDDGRYRLLLEAITDYAIYMLDPQGVVTSWNAGARRFKGYEPAEIIGEHFSRFYAEEDRQAGAPEHTLEIAARDGKFEAEGWRIRKDGTRFWASIVVDPIRSANGGLVGFAKITRDLTERRAAEEVLRRNQEEFQLLVQAVTDYAIYMLDPTGKVVSWNTGAERIKGYRPEEIIGRHFSRFYTQEDRKGGMPQSALDIAAAEGRFEKEGWRVRKDGTQFWANVVIDPIRSDDGALLGFAKITRDITAQRDAQRALESAREALFQSQKMEAVGQLTGGIAHDFNNLLTAIQGSLELLRRRLPNDAKAVSLLDNAFQAAERGTTLTKRMLAFARRQELDPETIDVVDLVNGMMDLLERSIGSSIQIRTSLSDHIPPVRADFNQLELGLLNLAVNARDAMPTGGSILISAAEQVVLSKSEGLAPGWYVCLSVSDTGQGMDQDTLARAADPFFTTKGLGKGTGLGLPMVLGMAEQSGGRLVLKSRLGEGTIAELWLPVADAVAETPKDRHKPVERAPTMIVQPLIVLAVDDDALVLLNTTAMLEEAGHRVFEAASGEQALGILRRETAIDLVITDQVMPNMTGSELAAAIKAEWPDLPVILATGYAELPSGANRDLPRLAKPFSQKELLDLAAATIIGAGRTSSRA